MDEWIQRKLLLKINSYRLPLLKSRPYHLTQVLVNTLRLLKIIGTGNLETDFLYTPWIDVLVYPFPRGLFNNLVSFYQKNEKWEGQKRFFDTEKRMKKVSKEAFCEKRENLSELHKYKVLKKARLAIVHQRNGQEQSPLQPHFGTQGWLKRGGKWSSNDLHEEAWSQVKVDKKDRTKLIFKNMISFQPEEKVKILEGILKRFKEVHSENSYKKEVKYSIDFSSIFSPSAKFSPPKERGQNIRFTEILIKKLSERMKEISELQDNINMRSHISTKLNLTEDAYGGKPIDNMDYGKPSSLSSKKKEIIEDRKLLNKSPLQMISHQFSKRIQGTSASMELLSKALKIDTTKRFSTLLHSKQEDFYQKAKSTDISRELSLTNNSSLLNYLIEGYWKNRGRKNITLGTQLPQYKEKSSIFTPSVQNTFNIKILGERREEALSDLADKISKILKEQARRHGIDLT